MARTKKVKEILDEVKGEVTPEIKPGAEEVANALEAMGFDVPEELLVSDPEKAQESDVAIDTPVVEEEPDDGFDMSSFYNVGDTVYLVHFVDSCDTQEVKKLRIRTMYKRVMVGCEEKGCAFVIGKDMIDKDLVFEDQKAAKDALAELVKNSKKRVRKVDEIPEQLEGMDTEEDGDSGNELDNYIDGPSEEE